MPYADPDKAREAAKLAARRRRKDPAYAEKQREYNRENYHVSRKHKPEEVLKARERANAAYKKAIAAPRGREKLREQARGRSVKFARKRLDEKATRPRPPGCEACGKLGGERKPHRLHFDHDHATGAFRGWLCAGCNAALGHLRDDAEAISGLLAYLVRTRGGQTG